MQNIDLPMDRFKSLVIAADLRLSPIDYTDDHIWELALTDSEPGGLDLRTTFGLRARSYRLFPLFIEGGKRVSNPNNFDSQPKAITLFPNFIKITFSPLPGIDVLWEVWVPDSHSLAMRFTTQNNGVTTRKLIFELISLLSPNLDGHRMVDTDIHGTSLLAGETAGLHTVIFQVGGGTIGKGPLPNYVSELTLLPGTFFQTTFIQAASSSETDSFDHARSIAARPWEAEIARIEMINANHLQIITGNKEWDSLFALAQQTTFRLLIDSSEHLPHPSFVLSRQPDQGYSMRGDGSDYNYLWNGQSPLQAKYLIDLLQPAGIETGKNIIRNFLSVQDQDSGYIDWKPGLSGQRSYLLATPVLANLVWELYSFDRDLNFLEETFPALLKFIQAWFSLKQDQDGDGIPEWDHPAQLNYVDHPLFGNTRSYSKGADISASESPALCAFLYQECKALIHIAEEINRPEAVPGLAAYAENVHAAANASWDPNLGIYHLWDRDTHNTPPGEILGQIEGNGSIPVRQIFEVPKRLVFQLRTSTGRHSRPLITLYGRDQRGTVVERILLPERWQWLLDQGSVTTNDLFSEIESLKVQGIESNDVLQISTYNFQAQDLSLTFPLFAQMSTESQADICIDKSILNPQRFWKPFGLPAYIHNAKLSNQDPITEGNDVLMLWNQLVGEALIHYGLRVKAAELFNHLINGILSSVKEKGVFSERYSATSGIGAGESNMLDGLPPIGLFLKALGVRILSPWKVHIEGHNPFPWPITLIYRGLTVDRRNDKTIITFPDGQTAVIDDPAPCYIAAG